MKESESEARKLFSAYFDLVDDKGKCNMTKYEAMKCAMFSINNQINSCKRIYPMLNYPDDVKLEIGYINVQKELKLLNEMKKELLANYLNFYENNYDDVVFRLGAGGGA